MPSVFLKAGRQLLPGLQGVAQLLDGERVVPVELKLEQNSGLVKNVALLSGEMLKSLNVGRIVRKTSERQAHWVIFVAVNTWLEYVASQALGETIVEDEKVGLFLGLGTVDCDDDDAPIEFDGSRNDYASHLLGDTKPLVGLILLNSSAGSHIAQLTGIKGINGMFSPMADAGAQALIEAYFSLRERQCKRALVAAGSQKLTPWYYLAYRELLSQRYQAGFPTESAAALVAITEPEVDTCELYAVKRLFNPPENRGFPRLQVFIDELAQQGVAAPTQVIYTGGLQLSGQQRNDLAEVFSSISLCCLDQLVGYTGPASALHGVHLAIAILQQQRLFSTLAANDTQVIDERVESVLIIAEGFNGQLCYLVVGVNRV
ncbi:MAG: hypothetical protein ACJA0N_000140 [Pseudohongiellaceae bacterium]|jgi:hypothetical protein